MRHVNMPYKPRDAEEAVQLPVPQFESTAEAWDAIAEASGTPREDFDPDTYILNLLNGQQAQGAKAAYVNSKAATEEGRLQECKDYITGRTRGPRTGVTKAKAQAFQAAVANVILSGKSFTKAVEQALREEYGIPEDWSPNG